MGKNNKLNVDAIKLKKLLLILNQKIKNMHVINIECEKKEELNLQTPDEENTDTNINDILNEDEDPFKDLLLK